MEGYIFFNGEIFAEGWLKQYFPTEYRDAVLEQDIEREFYLETHGFLPWWLNDDQYEEGYRLYDVDWDTLDDEGKKEWSSKARDFQQRMRVDHMDEYEEEQEYYKAELVRMATSFDDTARETRDYIQRMAKNSDPYYQHYREMLHEITRIEQEIEDAYERDDDF